MEHTGLGPADGLRHQLTDSDHFVTVVGISDDKAILPQGVENGKTVGCERADTPRRFFFEPR